MWGFGLTYYIWFSRKIYRVISFLRGEFVVKKPAQVVVDVNGVGYECQISLNTYTAIGDQKAGKLYTYLHLYENGQTMYGFASENEKELFVQLISVSGVGAATARMMLSGMKPDEIVKAIVQNNARQLETVKGIGKKTAERLVLELKDKLSKQGQDMIISSPANNTIEADALNALISLGIARPMAEQALKKVLSGGSEPASVEEMIKLALKNL